MNKGKAMGMGLIGAASVSALAGVAIGLAGPAAADNGNYGQGGYNHRHDNGRGNWNNGGNWGNQGWNPPPPIFFGQQINPWAYCAGIGPGWVPTPDLSFCILLPPPGY